MFSVSKLQFPPVQNAHSCQKLSGDATTKVLLQRKLGEMWSWFSISQTQIPPLGAVAAAHILGCTASGNPLFSSFKTAMPKQWGRKMEATAAIKEEILQRGMCGWLLTETQSQWFF